MMNDTDRTVQVHRVYIKAPADAIWDAITTPDRTARYGHRGLTESDLRPGGAYVGRANGGMLARGVPEVAVDAEVVEVDPSRKLVQTFRILMDPSIAAEGFTRLTYEIAARDNGVCVRTVTHDVTGAPGMAALMRGDLDVTGAGGGWAWTLSGLKTLLETGKEMES